GRSARPPKFVTDFNQALKSYDYIPQFTGDDTRPRKIDVPAGYLPYWRTPRAKRLVGKIRVLRVAAADKQTPRAQQSSNAKSNNRSAPLSCEARQSSQWQYQLSDFLREMAEWKPEHEASKDDYFHQKCYLFNELLELSPNSLMRLRMIAEYVAFLEQNRFGRE